MFENQAGRRGHIGYHVPNLKIEYYKVKINGWIFYDQSLNNDTRTYESFPNFVMRQRDNYTTGSWVLWLSILQSKIQDDCNRSEKNNIQSMLI